LLHRLFGRWRPWRVLSIAVATVVGIVLIWHSPGFAEMLTVLGLWIGFVFSVLGFQSPPPQDPPPQWLIEFHRWWSARRRRSRIAIIGVASMLALAASTFVGYRVYEGEVVPAVFTTSQLEVGAGREKVLRVDGEPPAGSTRLSFTPSLAPTGRAGNCVHPAVMRIVPLVGDQRRRAIRPIRNDESVSLDITPHADTLAVAITVDTQVGCRLLLTIGDAYFWG
jgi:hypothetical protein